MQELNINGHRLINSECLLAMDKLIKEGVKVDAIICDPTFGTTNRQGDIALNHEEMWKRLLKLRRSKSTPIVLFANGLNYVELVSSNERMFKYKWNWNKVLPSGMLNVKRQPLVDNDDIPVFYEKQCVYNRQMIDGEPEHGRGNLETKQDYDCNESNYNGYKICTDNKGRTQKSPTRIIEIPKDHPSTVIHSQQKPIGLGEYLVSTYTNEGDIVLDFMMGSGFVPIACEKLGRKAIGIDMGKCDKPKFEKYFNKPWNDVVYQRILNKDYEEELFDINKYQYEKYLKLKRIYE